MACENPFVAAIIARADNPKFNLAAFGVAFSFALIVEAPIIMLMTASTALVKNKDAFHKLYRFTGMLNLGITVLMLVILTPFVFNPLIKGLIGLPDHIASLTHIALLLLLPWPAAIGFRRFYQGLLIRSHLTRRVAYGTVVRLSSMAITAVTLFLLKVKGAYIGAAALSCGVVCEAIASRFMAHRTIKSILSETSPAVDDGPPLTYRFIAKFYYPLSLMSILSLGVYPVVTFFMGKSRFPIESLAVLPVINALIFIFRSLGLSFQEVGVALLGKNDENYIPLRNFAFWLSAAVTFGLSMIVFTPLAQTWFYHISGLSLELSRFAYLPARLMVLLPACAVWINFQRSLMVNRGNTTPISHATYIEVIGITTCLLVFINFDMVGAVAAAMSYSLGRVAANFYLYPKQRRVGKH